MPCVVKDTLCLPCWTSRTFGSTTILHSPGMLPTLSKDFLPDHVIGLAVGHSGS